MPGYSAIVECQDLPDGVQLAFGFSQTTEDLVKLMTHAYMVAKLFGWQLGLADEHSHDKAADIVTPTKWLNVRDDIVRELADADKAAATREGGQCE